MRFLSLVTPAAGVVVHNVAKIVNYSSYLPRHLKPDHIKDSEQLRQYFHDTLFRDVPPDELVEALKDEDEQIDVVNHQLGRLDNAVETLRDDVADTMDMFTENHDIVGLKVFKEEVKDELNILKKELDGVASAVDHDGIEEEEEEKDDDYPGNDDDLDHDHDDDDSDSNIDGDSDGNDSFDSSGDEGREEDSEDGGSAEADTRLAQDMLLTRGVLEELEKAANTEEAAAEMTSTKENAGMDSGVPKVYVIRDANRGRLAILQAAAAGAAAEGLKVAER